MMKREALVLIFTLFIVTIIENSLQAQLTDSTRTKQLEEQIDSQQGAIERFDRRLDEVEDDIKDKASIGLVLILFGTFCALWTQSLVMVFLRSIF